MIIEISNINTNNHSLLKAAAGQAGYAASIELVNETTRVIDLGDESHRDAAGITGADVERMITTLVTSGFTVRAV